MAVHLEATYAKKLGLPNFSSHQYSVTIRTELTDLTQLEAESAKLYRLLQDAVDREIVEVGYMPDVSVYGMNKPQTTNGNGNGEHHPQNNGGDAWNMTDGQKSFVLRIVNESNLSKDEVEQTAQQLFGRGIKSLDKMQASSLIEELLEKTGKGKGQRRQWNRPPARK
jgi:hypothetical protein